MPWENQQREVYDRGNGAVILLYNRDKQSIILTRQFRMPTYVNGNDSGMLIEACAGLLDTDSPEDCIRRETEEETGYKITSVQKLGEAYRLLQEERKAEHILIAGPYRSNTGDDPVLIEKTCGL